VAWLRASCIGEELMSEDHMGGTKELSNDEALDFLWEADEFGEGHLESSGSRWNARRS
jgi:hypothetical protein